MKINNRNERTLAPAGDRGGASQLQWELAQNYWKNLGYEVEALKLGGR